MNTNAYNMSLENGVVLPIGYERRMRRMQMEELVQSFSSPVRSSAANRQPWSPGVIYCSEHWNECILDPEAPVKQSEDDSEGTISSSQERPNHPSGVPFWQEAFRQWNESHGVETPMQLEWLSITVSAIFPSHGQTSFQPWNMLFDLATGVTFRGLKDRRNINIERSFRWKDLEGIALSNHPQTPSVVLFKRRGRYYHGIESLMVVACFHTIRMRAVPKPSLADFQIELRRHPVLEEHSSGPFFMHGLEHSFYKFVK